jgi:hypothetical protein
VTIGPDFVPRHSPTTTFVLLDGEAVLFDDESGLLSALNPTATLLWQLCDGTATVGEIVADLAAGYDSNPCAIEPDVHRVVEDLLEASALEGA